MTFRLSADEYDLLKHVCMKSVSRSISDFARAAVLERMKVHGSSAMLIGDDLASISSRLLELDGALIDLSKKIGKMLGPRNEGPDPVEEA